jgi:hypothetical protein
VDKEMNDSLFVFICNIYIQKTNMTTMDVTCSTSNPHCTTISLKWTVLRKDSDFVCRRQAG